MKRIYTILSCLLLVGMLCIGLYALLDKDATYSESERRKLKTRPKLTFSAMLDGSYASEYRDYFADTFPNREKLMNANRSLNGFYYFSGGSKDGAQLVINMNGGPRPRPSPAGRAGQPPTPPSRRSRLSPPRRRIPTLLQRSSAPCSSWATAPWRFPMATRTPSAPMPMR